MIHLSQCVIQFHVFSIVQELKASIVAVDISKRKKIQDIEMENTWKSYFPSFSFNKYIFLLKIRTIIDCCLEKFDKKIEED